jgi:methionine biosynthesis protein MetW
MTIRLRDDLDIIQNWIAPESRVLDLACGNGDFLRELMDNKSILGYGLEIDRELIIQCIEKKVNVIEQDLNRGLTNFKDKSFDTVVMTQALQIMRRPDLVLDEMLRVGNECIVTFPNFGNLFSRIYLAFYGRMPVTKQLSYEWYETPNIHFCTIRDFEILCQEKGIEILHRQVVAERFPNRLLKDFRPNIFGETAIYHLRNNP